MISIKEQSSSKTKIKPKTTHSIMEDYRPNQPIEVRGKQEGFFGSHYPATLLAAIGRNHFLVRYQTRCTEARTRLLIESVDASQIRPVPPDLQISNFNAGDRVEAFVNGGWWVGRIARKIDPNYYVRLDSTGNEVHCAFYRVRIHLEWEDGNWVYPRNGPQNSQAKEGEEKKC
ncbi:unnamed protein product [Camellia sinensis]